MKYFYFIFLFVISHSFFGQNERYPYYFGVQLRPLFPTELVGSKTLKMNGPNYNLAVTQTLGYNFGVTVRAGFTKLLAFETGISYTQRNYALNMSLIDTAVSATDQWSFINYEIPTNLLIYIQLSKKTYMNSSLGTTIRYSPTNIVKLTETGGIHYFDNYGYLKNKIGFNFNANVGFEYRSRDKGFFYFGGSVCVPMTTFLNIQSTHYILKQTSKTTINGLIDGGYLALDLKYFFPIIPKKGDQPFKGPND